MWCAALAPPVRPPNTSWPANGSMAIGPLKTTLFFHEIVSVLSAARSISKGAQPRALMSPASRASRARLQRGDVLQSAVQCGKCNLLHERIVDAHTHADNITTSTVPFIKSNSEARCCALFGKIRLGPPACKTLTVVQHGVARSSEVETETIGGSVCAATNAQVSFDIQQRYGGAHRSDPERRLRRAENSQHP